MIGRSPDEDDAIDMIDKLELDPSYYERRGRQFGEYVLSAYKSMRPDAKKMPDEIALHVLIAWVHSKRERGLL